MVAEEGRGAAGLADGLLGERVQLARRHPGPGRVAQQREGVRDDRTGPGDGLDVVLAAGGHEPQRSEGQPARVLVETPSDAPSGGRRGRRPR